MKFKIIGLLLFSLTFTTNLIGQNLRTPFESGEQNESITYEQCKLLYQKLAKKYPKWVLIENFGPTDSGEPLEVITITKNPKKTFAVNIRKKPVVFINNGIHPGEPEGIDATFMLARDYLEKPELRALLDSIVIVIVPIYNIGGALNRNSFSRANQNGPQAYGFRGNARNLDLNRDFVKMDSKNAFGWIKAFVKYKPDLLIDNHTSNGADYPYTLTYITTQQDKLNPALQPILNNYLEPQFVANTQKIGFDAIPYVYTYAEVPDSGIVGFLETPRYATGFAALHNCIGFTIETHMLKPFNMRLLATRKAMEVLLQIVLKNASSIITSHQQADSISINANCWPINYVLNNEKCDSLSFHTYAPSNIPSNVTNGQRLFYDQTKVITKKIPYFRYYKPTDTIQLPKGWIIPQSEYAIVDRLKINGIQMQQFTKDTLVLVNATYIENFRTSNQAYEGHYLHTLTKSRLSKQEVRFRKGDYFIYSNQVGSQLLAEFLDPRAIDSYFNWNFFDSFLQRKEHYSDYVFEEIADSLLTNDNQLKTKFELAKKNDAKLAENPRAQLDWIYQNSAYSEIFYRRLPYFLLY